MKMILNTCVLLTVVLGQSSNATSAAAVAAGTPAANAPAPAGVNTNQRPSSVSGTGTVTSETKSMLCGNGTLDVSACYFAGDYCSFQSNFGANGAFPATDFLIYNGDPSAHHFVVESGKPTLQPAGMLNLPLLDSGKAGQATASIVSTTRFLNYGSFEARLKTVGVSSVVTTFIGISNVLDEIDFEFTPKDAASAKQAQANWYYHGEAVYNVNFQDVQASSNTFDNFHIYRVDWTADSMSWSVDGKVFQTQTKAALGANATRYPATPMRISFGVWQAQDNSWAGPPSVNFAANPPQNLAVVIDYVKVIGTDCGGGVPSANPPVSPGFLKASSTPNWTPQTSSVSGSGAGSGNAVGSRSQSSSALNQISALASLIMGALAYIIL